MSVDSVGFWSDSVGFSAFELSSLYSPFVRVKAAAASAAGFCESKQRGNLYITLNTAVDNSTTAVLIFMVFFNFFFDVPSLFTKSPAIRTYVGYRFLNKIYAVLCVNMRKFTLTR